MTFSRDELGEARPEFFQASPVYHGVLASSGDVRLAVSPNGQRYLLQVRGRDGFRVVRWRKALSLLAPDVPPELRRALEGLPELPGDVHRPWAASMAAERERLWRSVPSRDQYDRVIAADGGARLARSPKGRSLWLQVQACSGAEWRTVKAARSVERMRGEIVREGTPAALAERRLDKWGLPVVLPVVSDVLAEALEELWEADAS